MDVAVDKLEALILKTENDLNAIACKLEAELCDKAFKESGLQLNPYKMIKSAELLKQEHLQLTQEYEELLRAQKEVHHLVQEEMHGLSEKLSQLEESTGMKSKRNAKLFLTPGPKKS